MKYSIALMSLALMFSLKTASADVSRMWNFDSDRAGQNAQGFKIAAGEWKVVAEPDAPSKPNDFAQLAKSPGTVFNIVLAEEVSLKDVDISVRMKAVAGREDQGGGLVWRAKDVMNYYVARFNPLEDNFRVYKVVNGKRSEMKSAEVRHSEGWHTLRVTMKNNLITCWYDGIKYLEVRDSTFQNAGKIGLWTKSDAQTHFDDLTVGVL